MPDTGVPIVAETVLEVISPDGARRFARVTQTPFLIGRGAETGNHLQLSDRRISRTCAAIVVEANKHYIEDRGQRRGLFVNGQKVESRELQDGDIISFGVEDSYEIIYRSAAHAAEQSIPNLLTRMEHITGSDIVASAGARLSKLDQLLAATALLHSQLPLDEVLGMMLDHAVSVMDADRGVLLEADDKGALHKREAVITEDLAQAEMDLQAAQSIVAQRLRAVVVIPLYAFSHAKTTESIVNLQQGQFLGVLYLDSRRPAAFSKLDRQLLDAFTDQAASILDNARLVARERERQRLEEQINIARDIQQALLPRNFRDYPHLSVTGCNFPCLSVGGDYFDVFPLGENRTAFLIADVSGKGLGAALLTTMLQGVLSGMTLGTDPARLFNHLNTFLCDHAEVGRYATMFFGILDENGGLEYINAGHPSPILIRQNGSAEEAFTEGSFPVGLVPHAEYFTAAVKLEPGDTVVLFSDGVTEAMDPKEDFFGIPRLVQLLTGQNDTPLDEMQKLLLEAVENFSRGASQADDLTLLLVRYRAAATSTETESPRTTTSASAG